MDLFMAGLGTFAFILLSALLAVLLWNVLYVIYALFHLPLYFFNRNYRKVR